MKPLHDWLLIRELDPNSTLQNGQIVDPDWYSGLNRKMLVGEILEAGVGRYAGPPIFKKNGKRHPNCLHKGQVVMFDRRKRELDKRDIGKGTEPLLWVREKDIDLVLERSEGCPAT